MIEISTHEHAESATRTRALRRVEATGPCSDAEHRLSVLSGGRAGVGLRRRRDGSVRRRCRALDDRGDGGGDGVDLVALAWTYGGAAAVGEDIELGEGSEHSSHNNYWADLVVRGNFGETFMSLP
jgi:hypothetical protein